MKRSIEEKIEEKKRDDKEDEISIKEVFKTLTLFFALTVITILLISGKFKQGVEDFWENNEKAAKTVEELNLDYLFEA